MKAIGAGQDLCVVLCDITLFTNLVMAQRFTFDKGFLHQSNFVYISIQVATYILYHVYSLMFDDSILLPLFCNLHYCFAFLLSGDVCLSNSSASRWYLNADALEIHSFISRCPSFNKFRLCFALQNPRYFYLRSHMCCCSSFLACIMIFVLLLHCLHMIYHPRLGQKLSWRCLQKLWIQDHMIFQLRAHHVNNHCIFLLLFAPATLTHALFP